MLLRAQALQITVSSNVPVYRRLTQSGKFETGAELSAPSWGGRWRNVYGAFQTLFCAIQKSTDLRAQTAIPVTNRSTARIMVCFYQLRENDQKEQSNISLGETAEV
ncbi:hypothetical protein EMIT0P100_80032 [Pseudomonas sp. IT-P100]